MTPEANPVPELRPDAAASNRGDAAGPSAASLLGGIVNDVQKLIRQHLDFFLNEIRDD
jgi:hypothetical protein